MLISAGLWTVSLGLVLTWNFPVTFGRDQCQLIHELMELCSLEKLSEVTESNHPQHCRGHPNPCPQWHICGSIPQEWTGKPFPCRNSPNIHPEPALAQLGAVSSPAVPPCVMWAWIPLLLFPSDHFSASCKTPEGMFWVENRDLNRRTTQAEGSG